jgi:hypothetical protein
VAIKVESLDVLHKSDVGGVRLGLASLDAVKTATDEIIAAVIQYDSAARIDGVLVQPMAASGTELVIGMRRDPMFGPIIMLGLGGIFVEALKDVAFARAPILRNDVPLMIDSLQGKAVFEGVRGQPPVDVETLTDVLVALSQLAIEHSEIIEIDLNPVFATPDGLIAVDWLVLSIGTH